MSSAALDESDKPVESTSEPLLVLRFPRPEDQSAEDMDEEMLTDNIVSDDMLYDDFKDELTQIFPHASQSLGLRLKKRSWNRIKKHFRSPSCEGIKEKLRNLLQDGFLNQESVSAVEEWNMIDISHVYTPSHDEDVDNTVPEITLTSESDPEPSDVEEDKESDIEDHNNDDHAESECRSQWEVHCNSGFLNGARQVLDKWKQKGLSGDKAEEWYKEYEAKVKRVQLVEQAYIGVAVRSQDQAEYGPVIKPRRSAGSRTDKVYSKFSSGQVQTAGTDTAHLDAFISECCVCTERERVKCSDLYKEYKAWAGSDSCEGIRLTSSQFQHFILSIKTVKRVKISTHYYKGLGLRQGTEEEGDE